MNKMKKRFIPTLLVVLLFAGTMVCAADQKYSVYMSPGAISYTDTIKKGNSNQYTVLDTDGTDQIYVRYTVVNASKSALTKMVKINGSMLMQLDYNATMTQNSSVRLKMENNTTDNTGRYVTAAGTWSP